MRNKHTAEQDGNDRIEKACAHSLAVYRNIADAIERGEHVEEK